jgi:hypothetical protein
MQFENAKRQNLGTVDFTSIFHARPKKIGRSCQASAASGRPSLSPDGWLCARETFLSFPISNHSAEDSFANGKCSQF